MGWFDFLKRNKDNDESGKSRASKKGLEGIFAQEVANIVGRCISNFKRGYSWEADNSDSGKISLVDTINFIHINFRWSYDHKSIEIDMYVTDSPEGRITLNLRSKDFYVKVQENGSIQDLDKVRGEIFAWIARKLEVAAAERARV